MKYISTRDPHQSPVAFSDILLRGLAPDGGLYVPESYPSWDSSDLSRFRTILHDGGYPALAAEIVSFFVDDIPRDDLERMTRRAYCVPAFADPDVVPVSVLGDGLFLGHLSGGPTAAFKDLAMQLLGELFEYELVRRSGTLNIVGATSGDTGSSAEYAMRGRRGIRVFMLTPRGRMTPFQQAQMFSLDDPNIFNIALDGVFDDCQDVVKEISSDVAFKEEFHIGAVNSINWARLMAQVVYYVACWIRVTDASAVGSGGVSAVDAGGAGGGAAVNRGRVSFCVPTGNFGDVCAGHIARSMGLPIDRLIVATNENDVLDEFFRTGEYRVRSARETVATSSPSMDISRASNFERFIFDVVGRDGARCAELFGVRVREGGFSLADSPEFSSVAGVFGFLSGASTHADRLATIRRVHDAFGVDIDPHTADGVTVAWGKKDVVDTPIVCLETALPVKFAQTMREALGEEPDMPERFADVMNGGRYVTDLPNDAFAVKDFIRESITGTTVG
ncbi:threonine synthase [Corynebacterium kroppenstedtii]|uniref:threonine synthase n=1 Tax=Corynebacterium sp. PCR 32 TaxID=3351342 RepID=UPI00309E222D